MFNLKTFKTFILFNRGLVTIHATIHAIIHAAFHATTPSKTTWSILKIFVNGKKIPIIPLPFVNDKFISNFLTNFSASNVNLYKIIVLSQNLILTIQKIG